nr:RNA-directed DNA polymerase, eukaryota [Tanacetum cinerariifolium]
RWIWSLKSSGDFSVASVRKLIDDKSLLEVDSKTRWIKYVPIKVNVHAWKVKTDSFLTGFNVSRHGIHIDSIMCAICDKGPETSSHLSFSWCMARQTIRMITRWWDVPYGEVDSYEDWINYHFIKEQVENRVIELYFVNTEYQLVDLFTKALGQDRIEFLINNLGMRSFTPETLKQLMDEVDE